MKKFIQGFLFALLTFAAGFAVVTMISRPHVEKECRETLLKQDLQAMRKAIDQYTADKEELPQSLEDLVTMGYIREIPIDPITSEPDWKVDIEEDTISRQGGQGVVDVHSSASGVSISGTPFEEF